MAKQWGYQQEFIIGLLNYTELNFGHSFTIFCFNCCNDRLDRINEADFKTANKSTTTTNSRREPQHQQQPHNQQQTSFLWTIGPRPFWELWPHKRHKKKKLNLNEFIQCLLLQWAKTHHYPLELAYATISEQMPYSNKGLFNIHILGHNSIHNVCIILHIYRNQDIVYDY